MPQAVSTSPAAAATAHKPRVGVVGICGIGAAIAENIVGAGFAAVLLDLDLLKSEATALEKAGVANDWQDLAGCEFVITMLPGDAAVLDAALRLSDVLATFAVHVSMSTIRPETARELTELHNGLGQQYVSAPVLGNPLLPDSRELQVFAASDRETLDRCVPLLERICRQVIVVGERAEEANHLQREVAPLSVVTR